MGIAAAASGNVLRSPDRTRFNIWSLRKNKKLKGQELVRAIFNYILAQELRDRGELILSIPDKRCYLRSGLTQRLYEISAKSKDFLAYIFYRYRILESEAVMRHLVAAFEAACRMHGRERAIRRFAFFDRRDATLYVSCYDGMCWRLDGENVECVPNGTGYALFIDDDDGKTVPDPVIGNHGKLLPFLVRNIQFVDNTQGGMLAEQQRLALTCWMFMVAFPELLPAKPILLCEGDRGSGKTVAVQLIQRTLHGSQQTKMVSKNDANDFGVHILRSPICLLDNVDAFVDWLPDMIASYVTGGGWSRRKLFTDDEEVKIRPKSFIAVTSRNPLSFKRDDVADRCVVLRLDRRKENAPIYRLFKHVEDHRSELFGEWLYLLNQIVKKIRAGILDRHAATANAYRMADFTALAFTIGEVFGVGAADVDAMLSAMQAERDILITEGDPLVDFLDRWLENTKNVGRPVTAADLHNELSTLAKAANRSFYKAPSTLGQKLRSQPIKQQFDVRVIGMRGNAKVYEVRRLKGRR